MLKFPYGLGDFYQLITEHYFYVDRTAQIRALEDSGKQLLFLCPRRFGKSLPCIKYLFLGVNWRTEFIPWGLVDRHGINSGLQRQRNQLRTPTARE